MVFRMKWYCKEICAPRRWYYIIVETAQRKVIQRLILRRSPWSPIVVLISDSMLRLTDWDRVRWHTLSDAGGGVRDVRKGTIHHGTEEPLTRSGSGRGSGWSGWIGSHRWYQIRNWSPFRHLMSKGSRKYYVRSSRLARTSWDVRGPWRRGGCWSPPPGRPQPGKRLRVE